MQAQTKEVLTKTEVGDRSSSIKLAGQTTVKVKIGRITKYLTIYVAEDENSPVLFGRDCIKAFWIRRLTKNVIASVYNTEKPAKLKGHT